MIPFVVAWNLKIFHPLVRMLIQTSFIRHSSSYGKLKRFFLAITVLGAAGVFAAESVYLCRKCRILTVKENTPSYQNCGKGGNHLWFKAAVHGDDIFHCRKCALLIYSKGTPFYSYCYSGGNHYWYKLAVRGKEHHLCRKCNLQVLSSGRPAYSGCRNNSNHNWQKL